MVHPKAVSRKVHRILDQNAAMVYRVAFSVLRNAADAEDVTQDVFLKLLTLSLRNKAPTPRLPQEQDIRPWLTRVTLNMSLNALRNEKSRRAREQQWCEQSNVGKDATVNSASGDVRTEDLQRAVQGLPPKFRLPVLLHYQEGLKYKDIALALDCPEGTIAKRIHTAKERLRERLRLNGAVVVTQLQSLPLDPSLTPPEHFLERLHDHIDQHYKQLTLSSQPLPLLRSTWSFTIVAGLVGIAIVTLALQSSLWTGTAALPEFPAGALHQSDVAKRDGDLDPTQPQAQSTPPPSAIPSDHAPSSSPNSQSLAPPLLWGVVRDLEEQVINDATVEVLRNNAVIATTTTDDGGRYTFLHLPPSQPQPEGAGKLLVADTSGMVLATVDEHRDDETQLYSETPEETVKPPLPDHSPSEETIIAGFSSSQT